MVRTDAFAQAAMNVVPIEIDSAAASITVRAVGTGRLFLVFDLFLQVEADGVLQLKSGTTDMTGPIDFTTATARERRWSNSGFPIFRGIASGDDFIIGNASTVQVNGWALLYEVETR
jgi:hypothetical protein